MNWSKLFSVTRNHSSWSLRNCFQESNTFLNFAFFARHLKGGR